MTALVDEQGIAPRGRFGFATFTDDRTRRLYLRRTWPPMLTGPTRTGYLVWVMLNPSKAGATRNDATINRIDAFTARHHFTRFDVVNLFSLIATDPRPLLHHPDPVGEGNDEMIARVVSEPRARVVLAWGAVAEAAALRPRAAAVTGLLARLGVEPWILGEPTRGGSPRHPLYCPAGLRLHPARFPEVSTR